MSEQGSNISYGRVLNVALAIVVVAAVLGFSVGIKKATPQLVPTVRAGSVKEQAPPSQPYGALRKNTAASRDVLSSNLANLRGGIPKVGTLPIPTPEERAAAVAFRATRRAYAGAPPTVPHAMDEKNPRNCLACHEKGIRVEDRRAPVMSHPYYANCTQCHVSGVRTKEPAVAAANSFVPLVAAGTGGRAWIGAPPLMPHSAFMRENCNSCHGVNAHPGLRTPHPERTSCRQCHVFGARPPLR